MAPGPNYITVGRNLAMELVRVTEVLSRRYSFFCCRVLAFTLFPVLHLCDAHDAALCNWQQT